MKKVFYLIIATTLIFLLNSCREKQKKGSHYTVYQAGQSGAGMVMQRMDNKSDMMNLSVTPREMILANIKTDTVELEPFFNRLILTGTTMFDPRKTNTISAWVNGQIKKLYVRDPGEFVHAGEKLYDLYSPELLSVEGDYLTSIKEKGFFNSENNQPEDAIRAMKQKLLRYGLSEAQIASLSKSGQTTGTVTIYSKANGYLVNKEKNEGDYVNEGDAVFQLVTNQALWVQAQLYDTEIPLLARHPKIWVQTDALPGKVLTAHIVYDNPVMQNNSRVQILNLSIDNPGGKLQPGMLANVYVQTKIDKPVLVIPKSAIVYGGGQDYIWMQMPKTDSSSMNSIFMRMPVKVGRENQNQAEILMGVQPGEVIVSKGAYLLNSEYILKNGTNSMAGMKM